MANVTHGALRRIGLAVEATRGSGGAVSDWTPVSDRNINTVSEYALDETQRARIEDAQGFDLIRQMGDHDITWMTSTDLLGYRLVACFGNTPTTTSEAGVHTHTFSVNQTAQPKTLVIHDLDEINSDQYAMVTAEEWSLSINDEEYPEDSLSAISKGAITSSETAPTQGDYTIDPIFRPQDISVIVADDLAGLSSGTEIPFTTGTLTVSTGAEPEFARKGEDGEQIHDIFWGRREATLDMTLLWDTDKYQDKFRKGEKIAVQLKFERKDITLADDVTHPSCTFTFANAFVEEHTKDDDGTEVIRQDVGLKILGLGSEASMTAVLVNGKESY